MKHIEINIGKACNNKCRFCMSAFVGEDEKELTDYMLIEREISSFRSKGYDSIGFLGGDISIHPKIFEIVQEAKTVGFSNINIITNGMLFANYDRALKLVQSGTTRVNISIHSHIDEVEDFLTQVRGGLQRKLLAIDNFQMLHEKKILRDGLSINIVLNGLNRKDIVKTCLYFYKVKKIRDIRINFLWNRDFYTQDDKKNLELSYSDFIPQLKELVLFSLKTDLRITFDTVPPCIFYKLGFSNPDYIVKRFLGEDKDHIEEISNASQGRTFDWKLQKRDNLKKKPDTCKDCSYFLGCQGIWKEYIEVFGESEFTKI